MTRERCGGGSLNNIPAGDVQIGDVEIHIQSVFLCGCLSGALPRTTPPTVNGDALMSDAQLGAQNSETLILLISAKSCRS